MTRRPSRLLALAIFIAAAVSHGHAGQVALLLEEPYGHFGHFNPTGHAAIYLNDVCAASPTRLRRCGPGESGVVLSRYYHINGYDWLAIPLIPYLYAVDNASDIPSAADPKLVLRLRDQYRREHLVDVVPSNYQHEIPGGDWTELVGESYDRRIYGFAIDTLSEQDNELIGMFNQRANRSHFNLFFVNCANFAEGVLNFYYSHAIHRKFIADAGLMTPKQVAHSLMRYEKLHRDIDLHTFVIPQVPGSIARSRPVDGIVEALVKSKKYLLPLALLHPVVTGTLIAAYLGEGRFHPDPKATIFDPERDQIPVPNGAPAEIRSINAVLSAGAMHVTGE